MLSFRDMYITLAGWMYPVCSHWAWDPSGWLFKLGYRDFAGSGVVHLLSGVVSVVACALIGARSGRFDKETKKPRDMPGHSVPMAALGGFILLFGFLAFNGGSQVCSSPGSFQSSTITYRTCRALLQRPKTLLQSLEGSS